MSVAVAVPSDLNVVYLFTNAFWVSKWRDMDATSTQKWNKYMRATWNPYFIEIALLHMRVAVCMANTETGIWFSVSEEHTFYIRN